LPVQWLVCALTLNFPQSAKSSTLQLSKLTFNIQYYCCLEVACSERGNRGTVVVRSSLQALELSVKSGVGAKSPKPLRKSASEVVESDRGRLVKQPLLSGAALGVSDFSSSIDWRKSSSIAPKFSSPGIGISCGLGGAIGTSGAASIVVETASPSVFARFSGAGLSPPSSSLTRPRS